MRKRDNAGVRLDQIRIGSVLRDLNGDTYAIVGREGLLLKMLYKNGKADRIVESGVRYHTLLRY